MKQSLKITTILLILVFSLALASCSLPTVTPPVSAGITQEPTITAPVPATAVPATETPVPIVEPITTANASQLKNVNVVPAANVQSITWSSDGNVLGLVTSNMDANNNSVYSAALLDGHTLALKALWAATDGMISALAPDGHTAAVISKDFTKVTLFDLADGNKAVVMITPGYLINNVTFSPDGQYFTFTSMDTWSVSVHTMNGSEFKVLSGFQTAAPVYDSGFAGNSNLLVWHARATAQLQDLASGTMGPSTSGEDFLSAFRVSPDGKILATSAGETINGTFTPAVTLWDTTSGSEIRTLMLSQTATSLNFSPDGTMLAVAAGGEVQVWKVASGTKLVSLAGHGDQTNLVAFSPDGKSLVSTGADNQLILWQVVQ